MEDSYVLRPAAESDAGLIAEHRSLMFLDMKLVSSAEAVTLAAAAKPWIRGLLQNGEYRGWFLESSGQVVAGGGLHLRDLGPVPGCLRGGRSAHIANVYTVPSHRRLGLARRLMRGMLSWCSEAGIDQVTLGASREARNLYGSLGFIPADEMKLVLSPGKRPEKGTN